MFFPPYELTSKISISRGVRMGHREICIISQGCQKLPTIAVRSTTWDVLLLLSYWQAMAEGARIHGWEHDVPGESWGESDESKRRFKQVKACSGAIKRGDTPRARLGN
jgi:hypothetical protein